MINPWFIGISSSVIATAIWYILAKIFKRLVLRSGRTTPFRKRLIIFSISLSTLLFIFGNILQPAVQRLVEPDNVSWRVIEALREHYPALLMVTLFVCGLLPGIITGLGCAKGHSLNQRIWFAIVSAIVSLSILDSVFFFLFRRSLLESKITEIQSLAHFGNYYFCLLSNLFGGAAAGLIVGSATHLIAGMMKNKPQNGKPNKANSADAKSRAAD